jgi:hypothetical protein
MGSRQTNNLEPIIAAGGEGIVAVENYEVRARHRLCRNAFQALRQPRRRHTIARRDDGDFHADLGFT